MVEPISMPSAEVIILILVVAIVIIAGLVAMRKTGVFGRDTSLSEKNIGGRPTVIFDSGETGEVLYYVKEKMGLPDNSARYVLDDGNKERSKTFSEVDLHALNMHNVAGGRTPIVLITTNCIMKLAEKVKIDSSDMRHIYSEYKRLESENSILLSKVALLESDPERYEQKVIEAVAKIEGAKRQRDKAIELAKKGLV